MNPKNIVTVFLVAFVVTSCAPSVLVIPTETVSPTVASSPPSPVELETKYRSSLPQAPSGFSWKIIPEYQLAVLVPDGWFFVQKDVFDMNVIGEVDVSQENFRENGKYSTGMAVIEFASDHPDEFATSLLTEYIDTKAITRTIGPWDSQINGRNTQNVKFNASFPDEANVVIQLSVITSGSRVYLVLLKSPPALWEKVTNDYDLMLNHVTIFDE